MRNCTWEDIYRYLGETGYRLYNPDTFYRAKNITFLYRPQIQESSLPWFDIQKSSSLPKNKTSDYSSSNSNPFLDYGLDGNSNPFNYNWIKDLYYSDRLKHYELMDIVNRDTPTNIHPRGDQTCLAGRIGFFNCINDANLSKWLKNNGIDDGITNTSHAFSDKKIISFWNENGLMSSCCERLLKENLVNSDDIAFSPNGEIQFIIPKNIQINKTDFDNDAYQAKLVRDRQKLHLLPSSQKKQAMKKLGVGGGGSGFKHPWQAALEKGGYINPGQKWRTPTSESFKTWFNHLNI